MVIDVNKLNAKLPLRGGVCRRVSCMLFC